MVERQKNVHSTLSKTALNGIFLLFYLTEKHSIFCTRRPLSKTSCVKELRQKIFYSISYIVRNFTCTEKKIFSACIKALQIKLLPLSVAR